MCRNLEVVELTAVLLMLSHLMTIKTRTLAKGTMSSVYRVLPLSGILPWYGGSPV